MVDGFLLASDIPAPITMAHGCLHLKHIAAWRHGVVVHHHAASSLAASAPMLVESFHAVAVVGLGVVDVVESGEGEGEVVLIVVEDGLSVVEAQ